jgi:uridine phosphorylase
VFDYKGKKIAAVRIEGIGAPHAVTVLEELIALGAKYFIALGYAGGLQRVNKPGDLILVTKAIRDEGTSYHYATPSKYSYSSKELNAALKKTIKQNSQQFFEGGAWTTDAPYKETIPEIKIYKKEGTLAVEMEASALFTVAKYRKAHFSQLLTLSDILSEKEWIPKFHAGAIRKAFKQMVQIAIDSFAQLK